VFALGRFTVTATEVIPFFGSIQPATTRDLEQVPLGDRVTGAMKFISHREMFVTHTKGIGSPSGLSDTIEWRGDRYGITKVDPWGDFGFWKAIGVRQRGA
jgi:hypothetical protein